MKSWSRTVFTPAGGIQSQTHRGWEGSITHKTVTKDEVLVSQGHIGFVTQKLKPSAGEATLDPQQCCEQIDRLVSSPVLHGSEALCKLLQYLARSTLNHPGVHLKEYEIATQVFGRPPDFDPQLDSTVRVQAGRLRTKLGEYYSSSGAKDPILVDVPKGGYNLSFRRRELPATEAIEREAVSDSGRPAAAPQTAVRKALLAVSFISAALVVLIFALLLPRKAAPPAVAPADQVPAAVQSFWRPFVAGPGDPSVVFSNARFVGRPDTGMRYFDAARDSHDQIVEHYTGVGEVLAVLTLERMFKQLGRQFRAKRGSLFTLDDAQNSDLIFVGSPAENLTLVEIPNTREFVFQRVSSGPRQGDLGIANVHPQPGEADVFLPTPPGQPMEVDYSIIALVHGPNPARWMLILAGTSTIGTQAAAEYVCHKDSLEELLRRVNVANGSDVQPFEALLRVQVKHDVPMQNELVIVRKTK